jgi:hypothetical protein
MRVLVVLHSVTVGSGTRLWYCNTRLVNQITIEPEVSLLSDDLIKRLAASCGASTDFLVTFGSKYGVLFLLIINSKVLFELGEGFVLNRGMAPSAAGLSLIRCLLLTETFILGISCKGLELEGLGSWVQLVALSPSWISSSRH